MSESATLELHGVSKSFGQVQALSEVDFAALAGEGKANGGGGGS